MIRPKCSRNCLGSNCFDFEVVWYPNEDAGWKWSLIRLFTPIQSLIGSGQIGSALIRLTCALNFKCARTAPEVVSDKTFSGRIDPWTNPNTIILQTFVRPSTRPVSDHCPNVFTLEMASDQTIPRPKLKLIRLFSTCSYREVLMSYRPSSRSFCAQNYFD